MIAVLLYNISYWYSIKALLKQQDYINIYSDYYPHRSAVTLQTLGYATVC